MVVPLSPPPRHLSSNLYNQFYQRYLGGGEGVRLGKRHSTKNIIHPKRTQGLGPTCLLGEQEDISSCPTGGHVFLFLCDKKACLLVEQEEHRRHVLLFNKKTIKHIFLLRERTCLVVAQEDMSSCGTRTSVFLFNEKTCRARPSGVCLSGFNLF